MFNLAGNKVYKGVSDGQLKIPLGKGEYIVKLVTQIGAVYSGKVIIR